MPQAENISELTVIQLLQDDGIQVSIDRGRPQISFEEWMVQNEDRVEEYPSYRRIRNNGESLYQRSFVHRGQRLIDVAIMNQHVNVRRRPEESCCFCLCRGHNIVFCGAAEKIDVENWVKRFTNVVDGDYKNHKPDELKIILKHHLIGATLNPMDLPILMLYFVVLGIRTPSSADRNKNYSIHKIVSEILRIRCQLIYRYGTDEQRKVLEENIQLKKEIDELKQLLEQYKNNVVKQPEIIVKPVIVDDSDEELEAQLIKSIQEPIKIKINKSLKTKQNKNVLQSKEDEEFQNILELFFQNTKSALLNLRIVFLNFIQLKVLD